jgi:hypothetical protein
VNPEGKREWVFSKIWTLFVGLYFHIGSGCTLLLYYLPTYPLQDLIDCHRTWALKALVSSSNHCKSYGPLSTTKMAVKTSQILWSSRCIILSEQEDYPRVYPATNNCWTKWLPKGIWYCEVLDVKLLKSYADRCIRSEQEDYPELRRLLRAYQKFILQWQRWLSKRVSKRIQDCESAWCKTSQILCR